MKTESDVYTGGCLFKNHAIETVLNVDDSISKASAVLHQNTMVVIKKWKTLSAL